MSARSVLALVSAVSWRAESAESAASALSALLGITDGELDVVTQEHTNNDLKKLLGEMDLRLGIGSGIA